MVFQVGYAQEIITPSLERPVYLAGFGRNRRAQSVHDDLYVRALALVFGDTRVVVAALDLLGLGRQHCREIEQRVNEVARGTTLLMSCTHSHHGPDMTGLWGPDMTTSGVDPVYVVGLKDRVVTTAVAALARTAPASMRSTAIQVTGLAKNARDPQILDEELTCLQFCHVNGGSAAAPLATWLIYPCHPEVLWDQNPQVTSDYVYALRWVVEEATAAPCLAMVGAIGGMMTPDVEEHSFAAAHHMGRILAEAALTVLADSPATPVERLAHCRHEYEIPMTNPLFRMAMDAGILPNLLNDQDAITTEANLLQIDGAWLFGVPGELLPYLGLAFKAEMRQNGAQNPAIVGLTNDFLGYILPQEAFAYPDDPFDPGEHYEETMSIGPEAGPRLQAALLTVLRQKGDDHA
jgi:hypothetical protein